MRQALVLVGVTGLFIGRCDPRVWERLKSNQHSGYGCKNARRYHSTKTKSAPARTLMRHLPVYSCIRGSVYGRAAATAAHSGPRRPTGAEWHTRRRCRGFRLFPEVLLGLGGPTRLCPCPLLTGPAWHITVEAGRADEQKLSARKQTSCQPTCFAPGGGLLAIAPLFV